MHIPGNPAYGHRRPAGEQIGTLVKIYLVYRLVISLALLSMVFNAMAREIVGTVSPSLYLWTTGIYALACLVMLGPWSRGIGRRENLLFVIFVTDILAITLLSDASRGIHSGLPILLVVTVGAAAVLLHGHTLPTLIAAMATLAILGDTVRLIVVDQLSLDSLFPAGLLGSLIFITSLVLQFTASRMRQAEALARRRATELLDIQQLNEQIIRHMQAGIVLVDRNGNVRLANEAAMSLLAPGETRLREGGGHLGDYSTDLARQFADWQSVGLHDTEPFRTGEDAPELIAHFKTLESGDQIDSLILVEDYTPVTQRAQSLKLTSLGRMSASIAHEVRNPLAAISHAAQLLQESASLSEFDRRMADIITEHCVRVNSVIESVLQVSRREPPRPEDIRICDWLHRFLEDYAGGSGDSQVDFECECPSSTTVSFDSENLRRVVSNLLDNARRHSSMHTGHQSATVRVSVQEDTARCFIDIIDQGAGVSEEIRGRLFEPFFTTEEKGSGLGLYLSRDLCEINNANLVYQLTERGESCFRVSLNRLPDSERHD